MTDFSQISNGLIDFFSWFFTDFLKGASDFLFGTGIRDVTNTAINKVSEALSKIGLSTLAVAPIQVPEGANNFVIIVSLTIFIGVGVGLVMLIKNLLFNWL